jgi:peptidoglycan/xylan/chitin deacetylase (PgdA/CDA1 family)
MSFSAAGRLLLAPARKNINVPQNIPFRPALKKAARRLHRMRTFFHKKAMILVYHRVAESTVDPWVLGVSPAHFREQLQVLQAIANPVPLSDLAAAKSDSDLPSRPLCITFDDGYADNLLAAKPALEDFRVPGTVFVTPGYLNIPDNLWWDEMSKLILDPATRQDELRMAVNGKDHVYSFSPSTGPDLNTKWRAWDGAPGPRQTAYLEIYGLLVKLTDAERGEAMEQLRAGATRAQADRRQHRCLTDDELRELAAGDLVEIGAHTLSHPVLSSLSPEQQQHEIGGSKKRLEELIGRTVTSFAYPYGKKMHYTRQTVKTVEANGFSCACSNFGGLVTRTSNRFTLPRFQPMDWNGEQFAEVVEAWYRE